MYRERAARLAVLGGAKVWVSVLPRAKRVLPDGCMDLLWDGAGLRVAGPDTRAFVTGGSGEGATRVAGVRLAPGVGPVAFGVPADELTDQGADLDVLLPSRRVRELAARVGEAEAVGDADVAAALESVAAGLLGGSAAPPGAWLGTAVAALDGRHGVAATARLLGWSERQFRRRSVAAFGYGPKTLGRVLRLQRAVRLADEPAAVVAVRAGYADQAHMAREVRDLTGVPWTELRAGFG
ncbi:helix-turn-helix domain-containing protein [Streptomyces avicenniae]|uniref:helix-turn-helix domain-containing protein n=1 Tax=Streptomyces avicenniae TaxID=500153 RepID=UPI00069C2832|nr:AraC family transcriptional regulator [Streptomyces avicenniae]